jgi:hypothetical protein
MSTRELGEKLKKAEQARQEKKKAAAAAGGGGGKQRQWKNPKRQARAMHLMLKCAGLKQNGSKSGSNYAGPLSLKKKMDAQTCSQTPASRAVTSVINNELEPVELVEENVQGSRPEVARGSRNEKVARSCLNGHHDGRHLRNAPKGLDSTSRLVKKCDLEKPD